MQDTPGQASADRALRFLFEQADIRGEAVQLEQTYQSIIDIHQYPPGVSNLLGEFLAAAVLLSTTLKFDGKLILQARSEGQIPLLMVECTSTREVRAIARGAEQATSDRFDQLLTNGQLVITIDPTAGQRYQGIVPLSGGSLASTLAAYFDQSEQLQTRFWLASDGQRAAGLLLQQLPAREVNEQTARQQQWEHACSLAATVTNEELLTLPAEDLLYRLYHEDPVRGFEPEPVKFKCPCSRTRTLNALTSLGSEEVEDLLEELGTITMDCEFCNQQYRFERKDLADLLGDEDGKTLH
jgi:molecular chaperone Hsp33